MGPLSRRSGAPRTSSSPKGERCGVPRAVWARATHLGRGLKLYGLGDVVTAPALRGSGLGSRVVREATAYIRSDREADAAVLLTGPGLEVFYRRCG
jgi:predicted GNAT family N-acyltransferase